MGVMMANPFCPNCVDGDLEMRSSTIYCTRCGAAWQSTTEPVGGVPGVAHFRTREIAEVCDCGFENKIGGQCSCGNAHEKENEPEQVSTPAPALVEHVSADKNYSTGDVVDALRALVDRLDLMVKNRSYSDVFRIAAVHGWPYDGPNFESELKEAKEALVAWLERRKTCAR